MITLGEVAVIPNRGITRRAALALAITAVPAGLSLFAPGSAAAADDFVLGATKPSSANTGVPAGTTLTVVNGDLTMQPGRTYQNLDIRGFVSGAGNAVLLNSIVRGRGTGYIRPGLVNGGSGTAGMRISRCTLLPTVPRYFLNGFNGYNCIIDRCDIMHVVDGVHSVGDNTKVYGSYFHDFAFFDGSTGSDHKNDPVHPGWNHTDGIECMGGAYMEFIGNNVQCYISRTVGTPNTALNGGYPKGNYTNGITLAPKASRVRDFKVTDNWLEGGDVLLQIPAKGTGFDNGNNGQIARNRYGADQKPRSSGKRSQMWSAYGTGTFTGLTTNIFDNVLSVPLALRGKPLVAQAGSGTGTPGMNYWIY
jgi:hypothetical protein